MAEEPRLPGLHPSAQVDTRVVTQDKTCHVNMRKDNGYLDLSGHPSACVFVPIPAWRASIRAIYKHCSHRTCALYHAALILMPGSASHGTISQPCAIASYAWVVCCSRGLRWFFHQAGDEGWLMLIRFCNAPFSHFLSFFFLTNRNTQQLGWGDGYDHNVNVNQQPHR